MSELTEKSDKLISAAVQSLAIFLTDWAILKWGWDLVLTKVFITLPVITWGQALIIFMVADVLFKQHTVQTIEKKF